jgi:SPP1 family predicted phage head-tail adaptor
MRAGDLDRRITLKSRAQSTQDALGAPTEAFTTIATVWAKWMPQKASERWSSAQEVDMARGEFLIRWRSDVSGLDEVVFDGSRYEVDGQPVEVGRREGLRIAVKRRVE